MILTNEQIDPYISPEGEILFNAALCRDSFSEFLVEFWDHVPGAGKLKLNWHMTYLCEELQQIAERVFKGERKAHDLCVNISPGTSKSTIISILFPAWIWTRMPTARILSASHTEDLALDLANKARAVIKSEKYRSHFPEVELREDQAAKGYYINSAGGDRHTCTVAGKSPMGFHGHFLLVDDPIDPKKVLSDVEVRAAEEFMTDIIPTRKVDKGVSVTILIMQRLGVGDPTDVMLRETKKEGAARVKHVCLPAELTEHVNPPELKAKYQNGYMDLTRLGPQELVEFKAKPHSYSTQFLQRPYVKEGGRFKEHWFNQRARAAPYDAKRVRYYDRAATQDAGCATAGLLMAKSKEGNYFVEHCMYGQWEPNERNDRIEATARRDRSRYGPNHEPTVYVEGERGSTGRESFQYLVRKLTKVLPGIRILEDLPSGSKDERSGPWSDVAAAGLVWLVEDGTWDVAGYVEEHVKFQPDLTIKRLGKLKDRVDASSGAKNMLDKGTDSTGSFRVLVGRQRPKQGQLRVVSLTFGELAETIIEERALLVTIHGKSSVSEGVMSSEQVSEGRDQRTFLSTSGVDSAGQNGQHLSRPVHACNQLLDHLSLDFADLDPAEIQERWSEPIDGKAPAELVMRPEHGKALWRCILKKREQPWQTLVVASDGDRIATSVACGVVEAMRLKKDETLWVPGLPEGLPREPGNRHVYEQTRASRHSVVG